VPLRELNLSHLHFHDLRSFAATLAAVTGPTTAELLYRLGHAPAGQPSTVVRPPGPEQLTPG
jgi:hypothetical protein